MSQTNAVEKIPTPVMRAEAAEEISIAKKAKGGKRGCSLESDIISHGWRYIQNDFKEFLFHKQKSKSSDDSSEMYITEEMKAEIKKLVDACLAYAEIDCQNDEEILQNSIYNALVWDLKEREFSYQAKEIDGSSGLIKESIDKVLLNRDSKLSSRRDNTEYRKYQRSLFTTEPTDADRKRILQFAYLLKMTSEEMRTYLVKWSFADDIRWNSAWEMAAAFEIERHPAQEEDRASTFLEAINQRIESFDAVNAAGSEDLEYQAFIQRKEQQEYAAWENSYRNYCARNLKDAFLCHWAWLLLISVWKKKGKTVPTHSEAMQKEFVAQYSRLCQYVQAQDSTAENTASNTQKTISLKDLEIKEEIIQVMKDRHLRLITAAYAYAHMQRTCDQEEDAQVALNDSFIYTFPIRGHRFIELPNSIRKIESKQNPSRSEVIMLGIELGLNEDGINQLLNIGGFYGLYARDFFEYSLIRTLNRLEDSFYTDGFRFAVKNFCDIRSDDDFDRVCKAVKKEFIPVLQDNYAQLSLVNRGEYHKHEPDWVKKYIRVTDDERGMRATFWDNDPEAAKKYFSTGKLEIKKNREKIISSRRRQQ